MGEAGAESGVVGAGLMVVSENRLQLPSGPALWFYGTPFKTIEIIICITQH